MNKQKAVYPQKDEWMNKKQYIPQCYKKNEPHIQALLMNLIMIMPPEGTQGEKMQTLYDFNHTKF